MDLQELEAIARQEFARHGLRGWSFAFSDTKRRLGVCKYRTKRIEIAEYYALNSSRESVLDTLLHEIAHAIAGAAARHGPKWKAVALRLGAAPTACENSADVAMQPGDWQATCPACNRVIHRYKRPMSLTGYRCGCPAHSPLTFEFMGDPARKPFVPQTVEQSAKWEAQCAGCQTVHLRARKPKAGIWRCKCAQHCELTWRYRTSPGPRE